MKSVKRTKAHRWNWSKYNNGSATCRHCGTKRRMRRKPGAKSKYTREPVFATPRKPRFWVTIMPACGTAQAKLTGAEEWRRAPASIRRNVTDYLVQDTKDTLELLSRGLIDAEDAEERRRSNTLALKVLREAARSPKQTAGRNGGRR